MTSHTDNMDPERGLPSLADASVDAIVTDPPAGIAFMGKGWDSDKGGRDQWTAWLAGVMRECLRVLKPGGHALVWALPRTSHWTATAVEDAGFEIRDVVMHLFGTGFPKSLDVSKAIDKASGAEREIVGAGRWAGREGDPSSTEEWRLRNERPRNETAPATDAARQWAGWGTALKPAAEHWILARKPLDGTVAANVLKHGTGALNIDGCRIAYQQPTGRWPANVTLDEAAAAVLDEQSGTLTSGSGKKNTRRVHGSTYGKPFAPNDVVSVGDTGGASRFFYVAKGSRAEKTHGGTVDNKHPTVKSIALMRWLVRLITPPGGLVLDPFAGSGTTGVAALAEGMRFMGMESDEQYAGVANARMAVAK